MEPRWCTVCPQLGLGADAPTKGATKDGNVEGLQGPLLPQKPLEKVGGEAFYFSNGFCDTGGYLDHKSARFPTRKLYSVPAPGGPRGRPRRLRNGASGPEVVNFGV